MAAPSYRASGTLAAVATGTTVAVAYPAGVQAGDLLVIQAAFDGNPTLSISDSSWTKVTQTNAGTGFTSAWWWKRASGNEQSTTTVTVTSTTAATATLLLMGVMHAWADVASTGTPFEAAGTASGTASPMLAASTTTTGSERYVINLFAVSFSLATAPSVAGYTELFDATTTVSGDGALSVSAYQSASAETKAGDSRTLSAAHPWAAFSLAILPLSGAAKARVTQEYAEVLQDGGDEIARVTQEYAEVLVDDEPVLRIEQARLVVLAAEENRLRIEQARLVVLTSLDEAPPPSGQTLDFWGEEPLADETGAQLGDLTGYNPDLAMVEGSPTFGTATLETVATSGQTLGLSGFSDPDRFGTPTLEGTVASQDLALAGFADAEGFGAMALQAPGAPQALGLTGFADQDRFGSQTLQRQKKSGNGNGSNPGSVTSGRKYATRVVMDATGLVVALEVYSASAKSFKSRMAIYSESDASLPGNLFAVTEERTNVVAGINRYNLLTPRVLTEATPVWIALHSDGTFNWLLSNAPGGSRFNDDAYADGISDPFGGSSVDNQKAPVLAVYFEAAPQSITHNGFTDVDAFGTTRLRPVLALTGIARTNAFGALTLVRNEIIVLSGVSDGDGFGGPTLLPGAAPLGLPGFTDTDRFGAIVAQPGPVSLKPAGFADADQFGTLRLGLSVTLSGLQSVTKLGNHTLAPGPVDLALMGLRLANRFGRAFPSLNMDLVGVQTTTEFGATSLGVSIWAPPIPAENGFGPSTFLPGPVDLDLSGLPPEEAFGDRTVTFDWVEIPAYVARGGLFFADVLVVRLDIGQRQARFVAGESPPSFEVGNKSPTLYVGPTYRRFLPE